MLTSHSKRIITACVLFIFVVTAFIVRGWFEFYFISLVSGVALWEFYTIFWPGRSYFVLKLSGIVFAILILWAGFYQLPWLILVCLMSSFWLCNFWFLIRYSQQHAKKDMDISYGQSVIYIAGLLYIPIVLQFLFRFELIEAVLVVLIAIASDTGAFYSGGYFGGSKIWPSISPKKTIAGSLGGLGACIISCLVFGMADKLFIFSENQQPLWLWALLGLILNMAAQLGDFFESALKRSRQIKDTSNILPGHGGIMDRIDSLLLVIAAYAGLDVIFVLF